MHHAKLTNVVVVVVVVVVAVVVALSENSVFSQIGGSQNESSR